MTITAPAIPQQKVFRVFISYASEDLDIAYAVVACFKKALPGTFSEVLLDKNFLQPGLPFQAQIETKLVITDVLVILYTDTEKRSHSYTGWEIGYFDRIMHSEENTAREKIALYLFRPPDTTASEQGIPFGISKSQLQLSYDEYESAVVVARHEPLCKLIDTWQQAIASDMVIRGFPKPEYGPEQDAVGCVRGLKLAIFQHLKTTVEGILKPQKQIIIRVKSCSLNPSSDDLPPDAEIRTLADNLPPGPDVRSISSLPSPDNRPIAAISSSVSLDIFGLPDQKMTWADFLQATFDSQFAASWRHAIATVVLSSFPDRVDVDNSQVVVTKDGKSQYRVILTTATRFYDDYREYNLSFVEVLQREDQGDTDTTYLLKGLELVCRFRFAFLEKTSRFSGQNISLASPEDLPKLAASLLREMNFLHRDAQDARLNEAPMLAKYLEHSHIGAIFKAYRPAEPRLRETIAKIMAAKSEPTLLPSLGAELAKILMDMEDVIRPENGILLEEMVAQFNKVIRRKDEG